MVRAAGRSPASCGLEVVHRRATSARKMGLLFRRVVGRDRRRAGGIGFHAPGGGVAAQIAGSIPPSAVGQADDLGGPGTWDGRRHGAGWKCYQARLRGPKDRTFSVVGDWFQCPGPRVRGGDPPADGGAVGRPGPGRVGVPVAEAEDRLAIIQAPKTSAADERPAHRRWSG
jgi:hypothetical protein